MTGLHNLRNSPLGRHPRLLGRKVAARFGCWREQGPTPTPPVRQAVVPVAWGPLLRIWTGRLPLVRQPQSFSRVFEHDFDESLLLRLCREGPRRGVRDLTGDIKLIWDFSRAHALVANAATGATDPAVGAAFLRRWLEANANPDGPAWQCAMDIAIRAVNWIVADVLSGGRIARELGGEIWGGWLWRHGWLTWRRLEARLISSNHYLANLVGLLFVGALFPDDREARRWRSFAAKEFPRALLAQTRADGGLAEASLRYHGFVTEMALLARLALGPALPDVARERLVAMCQVVADFRDGEGNLFSVGDDDSGRVLALDHAADAGTADVMLALAETLLDRTFTPATARVCPDSGWWIRRHGDFTGLFEFGGVGLAGIGGHAHNDDLSICVEWRGQPVFIDPGSGAYGFDPALRNRLRSARAHNLVLADDTELRPPGPELFQLRGADKPLEFRAVDVDSVEARAWIARDLRHTRSVTVKSEAITVTDQFAGAGQHQLAWRFHLHPDLSAVAVPDGFRLTVPGAGELILRCSGSGLTHSLEAAEFAAGYGRTLPIQVCVGKLAGTLPLEVSWQLKPGGAQSEVFRGSNGSDPA